MTQQKSFKTGKVALVGRPNTGKSTLLNSIIGQKVAIVSPKAQTTQSKITAVYEDAQCQIFFKDTPGFFSSKISKKYTESLISETIQDADILAYVIDHSRQWGKEEEQIKNLVIHSDKPFILVINKIDIKTPSFKNQYLDTLSGLPISVVEISALKDKGIKALIHTLLPMLSEGARDAAVDDSVTPLLSQNSQKYLEEMIREKIFLLTEQEVPYQATPQVTLIKSNEKRNTLKIKGFIETTEPKYKAMLIGKNGQKIKEIMEAVKAELALTSQQRVFIELKVK